MRSELGSLLLSETPCPLHAVVPREVYCGSFALDYASGCPACMDRLTASLGQYVEDLDPDELRSARSTR